MQPLMDHCPHCGCRELFIRKNFPQNLGLTIVIIAGLTFLILSAFPRLSYLGVGVLLAATLLDFLLYFFVRKITVCYRCRSEFRDQPVDPRHGGFELAVAEKYRSIPTSAPPPTNDPHSTTNT